MADLLKITRKTSRNCEYFIAEELLERQKILIAFTGRNGGVSQKPFDGLNLALHVGDDPECVNANRKTLADILHFDPDRLTCAEQVHGSSIAIVDDGTAGRGSASFGDAISGVDALITTEPDTPLALFFADCLPVVVVDPLQRAVSVIHAGWRGIYAGIIEKAVSAMIGYRGSQSRHMIAFVGPSIGGCCFRVDSDLTKQFKERFNGLDSAGWLRENNHIDLQEIARIQLCSCGIGKNSIALMNMCTSCNSETFYSYRAEQGNTGRHAAIACLLNIDE